MLNAIPAPALAALDAILIGYDLILLAQGLL